MKKMILALAAITTLSLGMMAGNDDGSTANHEQYCAKLKDGVVVVMHKGNPITADVTLTNGTVIKVDGTIIRKDGSKMALGDGECINKDGSEIAKKEVSNPK